MNILQLNTGLFPDAQTVSAALRQMAETHTVETIDVRDIRESDWDNVMNKILATDRIITI